MDMKKGNLNTLKTLVVQAIASMGGGAVRVRVFALFVLIFLAISAFPAFSAETINLADYVSPEYGHKDTATDVKYYKFDTSSENIVLVDGSAENHDFAYYVDGSRLLDSSIAVDGILDGDFIGRENNNSSYPFVTFSESRRPDVIIGDFVSNKVAHPDSAVYGGAVFLQRNTKIGVIAGNFIGNSVIAKASAAGGAIFTFIDTEIGEISGDFIGNSAEGVNAANGGAISMANGAKIGVLNSNFVGNYALSGGDAAGGAINNGGALEKVTGSFIGNYAKSTSDSKLSLGGAIYTRGDINIVADGKLIEFSGNYTEDVRGTIPNAIFVVTSENSSPTITLNATNNGTITFNDQIDGGTTSGSTVNRDYAYNLTLTGDKSSKIVLNNDIINANIQIEDTNVFLNNAANFAQSKSLDLVSGVLNIQNFGGQTINFESFSNDGVINIATVGVNLADGTMGHIVADNYGSHNGTINIQNLNIQGNSKQGSLSIRFADSEFSENVVYSGAPRHYTPVYIYDIAYNSANGNFNFLQSYNPAVLTSAVAQQAGAYVSQLHTYNLAFEHLDYYMNFSKKERIAMKNRKKYAFSGADDARTSGVFSPLFTKNDDEAFWVKPYSSFESIPLSGGVKVSNISYGTLIGHDSELKSLKNGWQSVITTYIGYNGASQRYSGIDSWQNGGTIGATATFYKNNFFNATTINAGASSGDARTMYGAENYNMLTAGIANKTGYNMEFFEGKFIVQPSVLLSYTFVNTFDFRNAAGLKINSDPLNAIQVAPGVKLIGNTKSGWQPYLSFTMAWNLIDQTRVKANDVWLPSLSIDPYVLYGAGVQKRWSENFTVYAQVMIYNGGRRGALLNFGLRWAIGKNK